MWDQIATIFERTVIDGSMLVALPVAALAGLVSFASPCVLPLLPGYVGYLGGMAGAEDGRRGTQGRLLAGVLLFVAGFSAVFVLLGVVFSLAGLALQQHVDVVLRVLGVLVIVMGIAFLGGVPFLQRDRRLHLSPRQGVWGAPVLGVVFGFGWAPCIGPTLAAVLSLSFGGADPTRGAVLALAYCLGLGVPFVVLAMAFARSTRTLGFLRRHRRGIQVFGGALLVLLGLALVTGLWGVLSSHLQGLVANFETVV
jgi:cytochrome c-type biogenesis protein